MRDDVQAFAAEVMTAFSLGAPQAVDALGGTAVPKFAVRVPRGRFVVRIRPEEFEDEAMVRFDHAALRRLAEHGLPVPRPQSRSDGTTWIRLPEGVVEVLSWRDGGPLTPGDLRAIQEVGRFLARFHAALADDIPPGKEGVLREDHRDLLVPYLGELQQRCRGSAELSQVGRVGEQLDMVYAKLDGDLYPRLPKAVIHGDVHPGNFKFNSSEVAAIYDFDYLGLQARARDIADALMFFAARRDNPLNPDDIRSLTQPFALDLERASVLLQGYQQIARLEPIEWNALPWLIRSLSIQIRLRGGRKVPVEEKARFVLDEFFAVTGWLDNDAGDWFGHLQARLGH